MAKVEWHPGELYPRVGFIVTNMARPAERVVAFYNQRGTAEQWIREGKIQGSRMRTSRLSRWKVAKTGRSHQRSDDSTLPNYSAFFGTDCSTRAISCVNPEVWASSGTAGFDGLPHSGPLFAPKPSVRFGPAGRP